MPRAHALLGLHLAFPLLACFLVAPCEVLAQERTIPAISLLDVESDQHRTSQPDTAGVDFRIGRDNLAFSNLTGVFGSPGDCWAFTQTAKLFFELGRDRFDPRGDGEVGFSFTDLMRFYHSQGREKFTVRGYASLFDMSNAPDLTESEVIGHLLQREGTDATDPLRTLRGREKMKYQLVLFLNTIQNLAQSRADLARALMMGAIAARDRFPAEARTGDAFMTEATRRITVRAMDEIKAALQGGRLAPLNMLNLRELGGHAVLGYKYEKAEGHLDIYVYDSNVQAGAVRDESILRITDDGRGISYHRKTGDTIRPDGIYDSSTFFSDKVGLAVMFDRDPSEAFRRRMALSLGFADQVNLFLRSTSRFSDRLGEGSTTLREAIRGFLMDLQDDHQRIGIASVDPTHRITTSSSVQQINAYLGRYTDLAVRTVVPHALPVGADLEVSKLELSTTDPNRAQLEARITLSREAGLESVFRAIGEGGLLMNDRELSSWATAVRERMGSTRIQASIGAEVRKGVSPSTLGQLLPSDAGGLRNVSAGLTFLHGVVGGIEAAGHSRFLRDTPFRVEIGKDVLDDALDALASRTRIYGGENPRILRVRTGAGNIDVRVEGAEFTLQPSSSGRSGVLGLRTHMRVRVRGHEIGIEPLDVAFRIDQNPAHQTNELRLSGRVDGRLSLPSGLRNITASTALAIVNANNEALISILNRHLTQDLLESLLGVPLIRFSDAEAVRTLRASTVRISAVTGWAGVDLDRARAHYFPSGVPVDLVQFHVRSDRILLGAREATRTPAD